MAQLLPSIAKQRYPIRYWMLVAYCVMVPNFVRFDASGKTHTEGLFNPTAISTIALTLGTAALLAVMSILNRQKLIQRPVHFNASLWLLLLANFLISTLLSPHASLTPPKPTDLPLELYRLFELVLLFILLLTVYSREEPETATSAMIRVIGTTCWINIGLVWFFLPFLPSLVYAAADDIGSTHARLGGALVNPVYLSVHAGIGFFYSLIFFRSARRVFCCALAVVTLFLTYARSEQLFFLIAVFAYLVIFSGRTILRWAGLLTIASVVALVAVFFDRVLTYLERGHGLRNVATLSERTDVWKASMEAFWLRPYLGYGFIVGVKYAIKDHWNATNWVPPHSHNEIIQTLVTGGIFAGILMVSIYLMVIGSAIRQVNRGSEHRFLIIALLQLVGMSLLTPLISGGHGQLGSLFLVVFFAVVAGEPQKVRVRRQVFERSHSFKPLIEAAPVALRWRQHRSPDQPPPAPTTA